MQMSDCQIFRAYPPSSHPQLIKFPSMCSHCPGAEALNRSQGTKRLYFRMRCVAVFFHRRRKPLSVKQDIPPPEAKLYS